MFCGFLEDGRGGGKLNDDSIVTGMPAKHIPLQNFYSLAPIGPLPSSGSSTRCRNVLALRGKNSVHDGCLELLGYGSMDGSADRNICEDRNAAPPIHITVVLLGPGGPP